MNNCKNCGADFGLHHYQTNQCPVGGVEAPVGRPQVWMTVTYEQSPDPTPARPTGPTPQYLRELEAELLATAAERNALRDKLASLINLIEGLADDAAYSCPFCGVIGDNDHHFTCLVNVALAAAKGEA